MNSLKRLVSLFEKNVQVDLRSENVEVFTNRQARLLLSGDRSGKTFLRSEDRQGKTPTRSGDR